ncbi:MAG: addiction module antidote protein, HigA family [Verrucomicrobia bacterium]|nr:MAG: addiction module antidote protein, HigA family [Verrucomicrobiota bacterium]
MKRIRILSPGEILLTEFIQPNNLTVYRVAKDSGISQPSLQMIASGKRAITAETALRLGLCFGIDAQFWLNLQSEYELRLAKQKNLSRIEKEVHPSPRDVFLPLD